MGEGIFLLWLQNSVRAPWLDAVFTFFTHLGDAGILWIVLGVILLCIPRTRKMGAATLAALAVGFLCTNVVLKHLVARPRPWLDVAGLVPLVQEGDPNSFPSGHTCAAFAFAAAGLGTFPAKWAKVLALAGAVLMGFSRLYVGVHYPSDVLAGALVGLLAGWIVCTVFARYDRKRLS